MLWAIRSTATLRRAWTDSLPGAQKSTRAPLNDAAGRAAAKGEEIVGSINEIMLALNKANVPTSGRVIVMVPEAVAAINAYYIDEGTEFIDASSVGTVLRNGRVGTLLGAEVRVDSQATYNGTSGTNILRVLHPQGLGFAGQFQRAEQLRHPDQFVTIVRGLYVYGR